MINKLLSKKFLTTKRKTFKLKNLIELYEHNYVKLVSLIPGLRNMENFSFYLPEGQNTSLAEIKIIKNSKYTSTLLIKQKNSCIEKLQDMEMQISVYHDLKMVEVVKYNGKRQFWIRNAYPNRLMLSKDEKFQRNKFLSEWLNFSKKEGLATKITSKMI